MEVKRIEISALLRASHNKSDIAKLLNVSRKPVRHSEFRSGHLWVTERVYNRSSGLCDDAWNRGIEWRKDAPSVVATWLQANRCRLQRCFWHENPTLGEKNNCKSQLRTPARWCACTRRKHCSRVAGVKHELLAQGLLAATVIWHEPPRLQRLEAY